MKNVAARASYWIAGILIALGGVGLTRLVAPGLAGTARIGCSAAGQLIALAGLGLICVGVSRRVRGGGESAPL